MRFPFLARRAPSQAAPRAPWTRRLRRLLRPHKVERAAKLPVHEIVAPLRTALQSLEKAFAGNSDSLVPLAERSKHLLAQCEELLGLAGGSAGGCSLFQEAVQVLHEPLAHVDYCLRHQGRQLELMSRAGSEAQRLLSFQARMHDMLSPLKHMVVLFKIESAHLDAEQQGTFLTVASEIQRMRDLVDHSFVENTRLLSQAARSLSAVRAKLSVEFEGHSKRVAEKRVSIEQAIRLLDDQLQSNAQHDIRLRSLGRELDGCISKLVSALQFQDILQQKCEHVLAAIEAGPGEAAPRPWLRLQISHLDAARTELERAGAEMVGALSGIEKQAVDLERASLQMQQFDSMTAAADGMVQLLLDTLQDMREIIAGSTQLAGESHDTVQPVGHVTGSLSSTIEELSINIRLIALNAQVRSVQLGKGSGLEVLAARTAEISNELGGVGAQTAHEIGELRGVLDELIASLADLRARGDKQVAHLAVSGRDVESRLHVLRDRTLGVVTEISGEVSMVRAAVATARATLERLPDIVAHMGRATAALRALDSGIDETSGEPLDAATHHELSRHARHYTMHSEREVHAEILGSQGEPSGQVAPGDVELFVDVESPVVSVTHPVAGDKTAPPASRPERAGASVSPGEIELF